MSVSQPEHPFRFRRQIEERGEGLDQRSRSERDRDRIIYTDEFRRLAGVTQVISATEGHLFHNRLTHVLEVAQIGRRLAQHLNTSQGILAAAHGGIDPEIVEAACLAHDIGHPPFGHVAEKRLNHLGRDKEVALDDAFEGNAQSFRIVTTLARRSDETGLGLNLTRAAMRALLKYPWLYDSTSTTQSKKWGAYHADRAAFEFAREGMTEGIRSIEAELMDWSDDIAYSLHDLYDFYRAGLIPLEKLVLIHEMGDRFVEATVNSLRERYPEKVFDLATHQAAWSGLAKMLKATLPDNLTDTIPVPALREFTSRQIGRFVRGITLAEPGDETLVLCQELMREQIDLLKHLTWEFVILSPSLALVQHGQIKVIDTLFEGFLAAAQTIRDKPSRSRDQLNLFPVRFHQALRDAATPAQSARVVIDYIAAMSDETALFTASELMGGNPGSFFDTAAIRI